MNKFELLNVNAKVSLLLSLTELIIEDISESNGYKFAIESRDKCWEWLKYKNILADDLYSYLENLEEQSLMDFLMLENDPYQEKIWICIANAFAYTTWEAYQFEKTKYIPQTIECVDYETIQQFIDNFKDVCKNGNDLWENLIDLLLIESNNNNEGFEKLLIDQFLKDNK